MSKAERVALKGAADEAGLGLTYSIGMTADMDLASENAATRKKGVSFLQDLSQAIDGWHYYGRDQLQLVAAQAMSGRRQRSPY
jgi:hypothetical protein